MTRFSKLNDEELHILVDFKDRVAEYKDECECDSSCFPNSRTVCSDCSLAVNEVIEEINHEIKDAAEQDHWINDERDGYLDDGQTFYNHHEANDSWFKD